MDGSLLQLQRTPSPEDLPFPFYDTPFEIPGFKFEFVVRHISAERSKLHFRERDTSDAHALKGLFRAKRTCHMEDNVSEDEVYRNGDIVDFEHARHKHEANTGPWHEQYIAHLLRRARQGISRYIGGNHDIEVREGRYALTDRASLGTEPGEKHIGGIKFFERHVAVDAQGRRVLRIHGDKLDRDLFGENQAWWYRFGDVALALLDPLEEFLEKHFDDVSAASVAKAAIKWIIYRGLGTRKAVIKFLKENPGIGVFRYGHTHMPDIELVIIRSDESMSGYLKEWGTKLRNAAVRPFGIAALANPIAKRKVLLVNDGDSTGQVNFSGTDFNGNIAVFRWKKHELLALDENRNHTVVLRADDQKAHRQYKFKNFLFFWNPYKITTFEAMDFKPIAKPALHDDEHVAYARRILQTIYRLAPPHGRQQAAKMVAVAHRAAFPEFAEVRKTFLRARLLAAGPKPATNRTPLQTAFRIAYRHGRQAFGHVWDKPKRRRIQNYRDIKALTAQLRAEAATTRDGKQPAFRLPEPISPTTTERFLSRISEKQRRKWDHEQKMRQLAETLCAKSNGYLPKHVRVTHWPHSETAPFRLELAAD